MERLAHTSGFPRMQRFGRRRCSTYADIPPKRPLDAPSNVLYRNAKVRESGTALFRPCKQGLVGRAVTPREPTDEITSLRTGSWRPSTSVGLRSLVVFHFISARFSQNIPYAFLAMLRNCRMVLSRARCRVNAQGFATVPGTRTMGIVRKAFYWRTAYWKDALPGKES